MLMNADVALYEAKRSGRGICKVFRPEMNVRAEERMLLGAELKDALAGVEAGRAGRFRFVVGVDRTGQADALKKHGADIVVADLAELLDYS